MAGVVDLQAVEDDPARHPAGVAEVVPVRTRTVDERARRLARDERAVPHDELSLPRASVVATKVEEVGTVYRRVLHEERAEADGVDTHVAEL